MLTLLECFKLLKNFPIAKTIEIKTESGFKKILFPYYMKASIAEHKLEKKAVSRIENEKQARLEYQRLKKQFPNTSIVIQEQEIGTEMIIGLKQDEVFGKLLMIGFGGTNAEVLKDIQFLSTPVNKQEIESSLKSLKLYSSLFKRKQHAVDKFVDLAHEVSKLDLKELDLNPVILDEKQAVIVDARADI